MSTNDRHTPGPWFTRPSHRTARYIVVEGWTGTDYKHGLRCELPLEDRDPAATAANAVLIANAPALLEALRRIVNNSHHRLAARQLLDRIERDMEAEAAKWGATAGETE